MDGVTYSATAWSEHCPLESLQGSYDQLGWDGPGAYRQAIADAVRRCIESRPPRTRTSLLDVACFTGEYYGKLKDILTLDYFGVDVTLEYVEAAHKRWGAGPTFEQGSALALPYPDQSADIVLCAGLLIHVDNPARVISECFRVARSAVVIGATVHDEDEDVRGGMDGPFINRTYSMGYISDLISGTNPGINRVTAYKEVDGQGIWATRWRV